MSISTKYANTWKEYGTVILSLNPPSADYLLIEDRMQRWSSCLRTEFSFWARIKKILMKIGRLSSLTQVKHEDKRLCFSRPIRQVYSSPDTAQECKVFTHTIQNDTETKALKFQPARILPCLCFYGEQEYKPCVCTHTIIHFRVNSSRSCIPSILFFVLNEEMAWINKTNISITLNPSASEFSKELKRKKLTPNVSIYSLKQLMQFLTI